MNAIAEPKPLHLKFLYKSTIPTSLGVVVLRLISPLSGEGSLFLLLPAWATDWNLEYVPQLSTLAI